MLSNLLMDAIEEMYELHDLLILCLLLAEIRLLNALCWLGISLHHLSGSSPSKGPLI